MYNIKDETYRRNNEDKIVYKMNNVELFQHFDKKSTQIIYNVL